MLEIHSGISTWEWRSVGRGTDAKLNVFAGGIVEAGS
jgi:hypothetical protein